MVTAESPGKALHLHLLNNKVLVGQALRWYQESSGEQNGPALMGVPSSEEDTVKKKNHSSNYLITIMMSARKGKAKKGT